MLDINGKEWTSLTANDVHDVLVEQDFEESFYFEFKDDRVTNKKLMEEVSAFANTFGGYIFIGISDDKQIEGCSAWNEQRIHTTIHDSITPTPSFDVKKLTIDSKVIYVIKIDEGAEPPYITSSGKIYERLSSGSFTIKDSARLSQIYTKREQLLAQMERKISIPPVDKNSENIFGYIDIGFALVTADDHTAINIFNQVNLKDIAKKIAEKQHSFNLVRVGNSITYTPGGISTKEGLLPAHTNNFLEIMSDGSARMRLLLINNEINNPNVNMLYARSSLNLFKDAYSYIMGDMFPDKFVYAKKYESLNVRKQFHPILYFDQDTIKQQPDSAEDNQKIFASIQKYRKEMGIDTIVTDDRIPKTGLYMLDKRKFESVFTEYTRQSIIDGLFLSSFALIGSTPFVEAFNSELCE